MIVETLSKAEQDAISESQQLVHRAFTEARDALVRGDKDAEQKVDYAHWLAKSLIATLKAYLRRPG